MKAIQPSQSNNQQLRDILNQLEVAPRSDAQFEAGAWLRLSDDINFGIEINQGHVDVMKQKVLKAIKENGISVMQKICGKTPFNYNNVFEELPYQAVVPSDLGLPIIVESQMTYLVSLQGEVNIECSLTKPSAQLELSKKLSYTYNGHAGTVCPFTKQMLTAGINIHRATNIPVITKVEVEPQTNKLTVAINPSSQVSSDSSNIDVHHYHVKPYTVMKSSVYQDATPSAMSPNTKVIHSQASPKTFQAQFGQSLGVDMKLKVETELESCLSKLNSNNGYAFNAQVNCKLTGAETQTYSYSLTAGAGADSMEHKWDLDLHLQNQNKMVCMAGKMMYPTTSSSLAKFQYENKLGFGSSCEEYYVNVEGYSQVSEYQRQKSLSSKESQKCEAKTQEEQRLRQKIKTVQVEEEKKKVEKKHAKVALEKLKYCSKKTEQSRTVDYTEFDISYSQELPQKVYSYAKTV